MRFERFPVLGRFYTKNERRFPAGVRYGDIVKGLPVPTGGVRGCYCSHTLEHLSLEGFRIAIGNTYKYLRPDGVFRFVLPDLHALVEGYRERSLREEKDACEWFMSMAYLGERDELKTWKQKVTRLLGNTAHRTMWDYSGLESELGKTGFVSIRRAVVGDSADRVFDEAEDASRWDQWAVGVECRKPSV